MDYSTEELISKAEDQRNRNLAMWYICLVMLISFFLFCFVVLEACAEDTVSSGSKAVSLRQNVNTCTDPSTLPNDLKKAYYALKNGGYDVKPTCAPVYKQLTVEQIKAIESLR